MIFVRDLGAMERFYRDIVGLVPVETSRQADWVEFEGGFSLHRIPQHILGGLSPLGGDLRESGSTKLGFSVASVAAEVARLRGLGVPVIERPWGGFDFTDPEGNIGELEGPPGAVQTVPPMTLEPASEPEPLSAPESQPAKHGLFDHRIPPLVVTLLFCWLMGAIAGMAPFASLILPMRGLVAGPIALVGLLLMLIASVQFRSARTTVDPLHPAAARLLVTGGLFRLSRNPIYLGMLVVLLGWAVFLGNPLTLLGAWLFTLFLGRFQILPEERALRAQFGDELDAYAARVRRWI
ncbi:MAG: methyltransferase [Candidatus Andeanibacterium colombiense]|uniref:Methyltransferase n=1 Tax=Candidatus Andeanibacterium colombiense TaxID=3121345 RepID=A0AAJ6BNF9_9SPHN|nr:MAG: methyltransferase [Sphingomonadaceae bacterium]